MLVQRFGFRLERQLEMADDVLCVRVSPDGKLLAASLLDHTIKVYYTDSLKFFLSLYGHKLPATTLDISSDSTLLISGSADKNIKVGMSVWCFAMGCKSTQSPHPRPLSLGNYPLDVLRGNLYCRHGKPFTLSM
jgi:WD40 repeat protein